MFEQMKQTKINGNNPLQTNKLKHATTAAASVTATNSATFEGFTRALSRSGASSSGGSAGSPIRGDHSKSRGTNLNLARIVMNNQ